MKREKIDLKKNVLKKIEHRHNKHIYIERKNIMNERDQRRNVQNTVTKKISFAQSRDERRNIKNNVETVKNTVAESRDQKRTGESVKPPTIEEKFLLKYEKKECVDYDAIIVISSYNRLKQLKKILRQLKNQKTQYSYKIIVLNDGSTENYDELVNKFDIIYLKNEINQGKKLYWKSITTLFTEASNYNSHVVIQIDDDFVLCNNFIENLLNEFFRIKNENNKYIAIYYHKSINYEHDCNRWGLNGNWVDGGTLYDYEFLKLINFSISKISPRRWDVNPRLSSGVWHQVSKNIYNHKLLVFVPDISYATHIGNHDSKMNFEQRINNPINSLNNE